jgi:tetratricopeptide (TPR) repeat protein
MKALIRLIFVLGLSVSLYSCSQKQEKKQMVSHISFRWSEKIDSLLNDTSKSKSATNLLKKRVLTALNDTQAINRLNGLTAVYTQLTYPITAEAIRQSLALNYQFGIISALSRRGEQFMIDSKVDSAEKCFNKAIAMAEKRHDKRIKANLLYREAKGYYDASVFQKSVDCYNNALIIADSLNDKPLEADCLYEIGETDRMIYNYFDALGVYNRAIQAAYEIADTPKVIQCLSSIGEVYRMQSVYPTALFYYNECMKMAEKAGNKSQIDFCLSSIGEVYHQQADNIKAMDYFNQSIKVAKEINDRTDVAACLTSLAAIYSAEADFVKALEFYNQAIKIDKELDDEADLAYALVGMGDIYKEEKDYVNAISSYKKGMAIGLKTDDKGLYNTCLILLGEVFREQVNYAEALNYYNKAIELAKKIDDEENLSNAYYDIGEVYRVLNDNKEATDYYQKSLEIARSSKANHMIAACLYGLGEIYVKNNNVQKAKEYAEESLKAAQASNEPAGIKNAAKLLSQASKQLGDFKTALDMHELYSKMKDSLNNTEEIKKFSTVEYKSKEDQLKSEQEKTTEVFRAEADKREAELKRQKTIQYAFIVGFILVLLFSGLIYRGLRQNKKKALIITRQKEEVERQKSFAEEQKALVDEKNKEIVDSINYAKRLQDAILPPIDLIEQHLPESFILYKPKAIVAGDFYWMEKMGDEILIAAADCTGHGVPGAMVSVVCSNALNRAVKEFNLREPGEILDKVRDLVVETFERSGSEVKDGMDISLASLNTTTREMKWSGANNPLWYLQDNELKEIRPDKQPIGLHDYVKPFTTHNITLKKGDTVYLFSDGYADQFGGDKGKKFKYRQIQTKLVEIATASLKQQGDILHQVFEEWKGMLEQVDDVLMIGIRL